jgi:hypothetical protein
MQRLATDALRENLQCFWSPHLFPALQYDIIPGTQKLVMNFGRCDLEFFTET